jgi:poly(ADP-ribose) glycohydrolase ARH3
MAATSNVISGSANLRNRFRGAIVGALIGDCLGAYWERQSWKGVHSLEKVKAKIADQVLETRHSAPLISYTDDTALTLALGESMVECGKFEPAHCAQK